MLKHYLITAFRRMFRERIYVLINMLGLSTGIAFFVVMALFVRDELSYNQHLPQEKQLFRVLYTVNVQGISMNAPVPGLLGATATETYPGIQSYFHSNWGTSSAIIKHDGDYFREPSYLQAESGIFDLGYRLKEGNLDSALSTPQKVVITPKIAHKYFPDQSPIGEALYIDQIPYKVSGVLEEPDFNSTFQFDLLSLPRQYTWAENPLETWKHALGELYLVTDAQYDKTSLKADLDTLLSQHGQNEAQMATRIDNYTDMYLYSGWGGVAANAMHGDLRYIYIFSAIGLLILIIACINYMNLATARAAERSKEIGVRKVMGARRTQLVKLLMGEAMILTTFAVLLGAGIAELLLRPFNILTGKSLALNITTDPVVPLVLLALIPIVSAMAAFYPAVFLSAFAPVKSLKGRIIANRGSSWLRQGLVVFQFCISVGLIICTLVIKSQLSFIQQVNLGFDEEQLLALPNDTMMMHHYDAVKQEMLQIPGVEAVTHGPLASTEASRILYGITVMDLNKTDDIEEQKAVNVFTVAPDFLNVLGIEMLEGRNLTQTIAQAEGIRQVVVNQEFVRGANLTEPLGYRFLNYEIIGVIDEFKFNSMKSEVPPMLMYTSPNLYSQILLRLKGDNVPETMASIRQVWKSFDPTKPFEPIFVDDALERNYQKEINLGNAFTYFALAAILIGCLGLFGLATFTAQKRTKEIGIRKVLGASVSGLVLLLTKDFTKLILLAFVLAVPMAWLLMDEWLTDFAYRIRIGWEIMAFAGVVSIIIAWMVVGVLALRASNANPAHSLRNE